jgi:MerR family transcriptional regulator, copper efflux regulator
MLIGELARISGMSKDGIRHYEEVGLIRSTERRAGSRVYREYDAAAVARIEQVRQAQRLGLSLREIVPLLDAYADREVTLAETVAFLEERLAVVRGKVDELREIENFIVQKLERYGAKRA